MLQRFRAYADSAYAPPAVQPGAYNSVMPWTMYGHMKEDDLKAIFAYLQTVPPIENQVVKFSEAGVQ